MINKNNLLYIAIIKNNGTSKKFITLDELKAFLYIDNKQNNGDTLLTSILHMVIEYVENLFNITIEPKALKIQYKVNTDGYYKLYRGPKIEIKKITYNNDDKNEVKNTDYQLFSDNTLEIKNLNNAAKTLEITYGSSLHENEWLTFLNTLKIYMLMHMAHIFQNRHDIKMLERSSMLIIYNSLMPKNI